MSPRTTWNAAAPLKMGVSAMFILVVVLGAWSFNVRIAGAIIGMGSVHINASRQAIQHPTGGVVSEIGVFNGEFVTAGTMLFRLDDTLVRHELNTLEGELYQLLAIEARLNAEISGASQILAPAFFTNERINKKMIEDLLKRQQLQLDSYIRDLRLRRQLLEQKILQIRSQISGIEHQRLANKEKITILEKEVKIAQSLLVKELITNSEIADKQKEHAQAVGASGSFEAKIGELKQKITELKLEILSLPAMLKTLAMRSLSDLQPKKIRLLEKRIELLEILELHEVRTPISGIIHDSQILGIRSIVPKLMPVMYIVADGKPKLARIKVDIHDVDEVHVGQTAWLEFSSFNRGSTPRIIGIVRKISADIYIDEVSRKNYYETEVEFLEGELEKLEGQQIVNGMPVIAFFKTSDRTPFDYIARPVREYFNRAFRD